MSTLDEWLEKAESDYHVAVALSRLRKRPEPDAICYHSQQCAEKYLKGYLVLRGDTPPYIHDLIDLLNLCAGHDPTLAAHAPQLLILNQYAVHIRYPGMSATVAQATDVLKILRHLRTVFRRKLGL